VKMLVIERWYDMAGLKINGKRKNDEKEKKKVQKQNRIQIVIEMN